MTDRIRVTLEIGPKNKKVIAVAADWPGLERGAIEILGCGVRLSKSV